MQKRLLSGTLILMVLLLIVGLAPIHGEAEVYDTVVRLHVLANSDSEEDQAQKLRVRDAILAKTTPLLAECRTREEAEQLLLDHLEEIRLAAVECLRAEGAEREVTVELGIEPYPERSYDAFCFPAGEYLSLRVCIGEAQGQNWWCCLFPPICLGAASVSKESAEDAFISVGFTPSQYKVITESDRPVYRVRFKLLELFGGN